MNSKPEAIDTLNIWPGCKIQIIDETLGEHGRFVTQATCAYTPNAIQAALTELDLHAAWVKSLMGREYIHRVSK